MQPDDQRRVALAIPDFQTIMLPVLRLAGDGAEHTLAACRDTLADEFGLSAEARAQLLPSGRQATFSNRVAWSSSYLRAASLLESTGRGRFRITERGRSVITQKPTRIDIAYLMQFPEFKTFRDGSGKSVGGPSPISTAAADLPSALDRFRDRQPDSSGDLDGHNSAEEPGPRAENGSDAIEEPRADWVFEHGLDVPFGELCPWLAERRDHSIEAHALVPTRLRNVLGRWHGLTWGPYLEATPRQLLARPRAGADSLAAFIEMADAVRATPLIDAISKTPPESLQPLSHVEPKPAAGPQPDPMMDLLTPIIGWGTFERGRADLADILVAMQREAELPVEIAKAMEGLGSIDLRGWASAMAPTYDPWSPVRGFLAGLDDRDRTLVRERLVTLDRPATLEDLASRLGVTRERVRQVESKLAKQLRSMASDHHSALGRAVKRVQAGIGLAMQVAHAEASEGLSELKPAPLDTLETGMILWLAGPYQVTGEWLVRRPTQKAVEGTRKALRAITSSGTAGLGAVEDALQALGMRSTEVREWVVSVGGFRVHDEQVVRWGGSIADKAETVLRLNETPLSREELAMRLGPGTNWRSMANQLYGDPRFKRTGIRHFGLAQWDNDEYTGVADEIAQEIGRQGGEAQLEHLVTYVSTTYGVAGSSVRAYASGPRFERAPSGAIRLRTEPSLRRGTRSIEMTRGAFLMDGAWGFRVRVTDQHLRGSGFPIPEAVARAFGLEPRGTRDLDSPWGNVRLGWPSLQPHIGSIRQALEAMHAVEGDLLFLAASDSAVDFQHVARGVLEGLDGLDRLAAEVGSDGSAGDRLSLVARALALEEASSAATVARRLRARGEDELASLATPEEDDGPLVLSLGAARYVEFKLSR